MSGGKTVRIGVIDIGSNTTRLLVADATRDTVDAVVERRHFIPLAPDEGQLASDVIDALCRLASDEAEAARGAGARDVIVVATAAVRAASNRDELARSLEASGAGSLRVLEESEEAELAFLGATRTYPGELPDRVGVADIGGGSTELIVGSPGGTPEWWESTPLGSATVTAEALRSDPPSEADLALAAEVARAGLGRINPPRARAALVVGGGSASLRRFAGTNLDRETIQEALARLRRSPAATLAEQTGLAAERVRLLPAALIIIDVLWSVWGLPVRVAHGGQREGLAMRRAAELAGASGVAGMGTA